MRDEQRFLEAMGEHRRLVLRLVNLYVDDADERKDLEQEVWLQAWKAWPTFRGEAKLSTWLYRVALNTILTLKRRPRVVERNDHLEQLPGVGHDPSIRNALNVVLNYGLIFGKLGLPALGVPGAAWGTVVSQAVGLAILVATIRRGRVPGLFIPLRPHGLDRSVAKELLQVGAPAAADLFIFNAGFLSIVGMLGRIDPVAVAAHGVGLRIQSLAFVPGLGISQAMGAMVGNALGARDIAEAKAVFSAGLRLSTGAMTAIGFGLVAGAAPLLAVFHVAGGTTLGALSTTWMRILGLSMPIVGVYVGIMGVFRGSGDTTTSLRVNVVGTACLIPLSYLLGFPLGLGAFGVWLAFPLSFVIKAVYGLFEYRRDRWARVGVALQA